VIVKIMISFKGKSKKTYIFMSKTD